MLKNYLKIAWRNLVKNRASSIINIGGLAVGMAVTMLISLWIWDELSFNKYHQNYDRIVQVVQKEKFLGSIKVWENMPYRLVNELETDYKNDFKHVVVAMPEEGYSLSAGEKKIPTHGLFISASAPEMLTLKMLKGSWNGLNDPHSVLISASVARALFGNDDPTDKTLKINDNWDATNKIDVKVSGVYEDLPANTAFHDIQYFSSWNLYISKHDFIKDAGWEDHRVSIYAELQPGIGLDNASANVKGAELKVIKGLDNMKGEVAANPEILLHPMSRWHLYSNFKNGVAETGPIEFVWLVGIIGIFVLLLACINFMNLSTARSEKRAKEVGIRKAIGSARRQLVVQFFIESILVASVSFAISILLVMGSLNWFNNLAAKQIVVPFANYIFWLSGIGFILITGLLAGSYPAFYLSSFKPVKVLKGVFRAGRLAALPRRVLVVLQFSVSVALIICTIVVYNQIIFAKNRPVGYSRAGLLMIPMRSQEYFDKNNILQSELKNTGAITEVAESESPLTDVSSHNAGFTWQGKDPSFQEDFGTLTVTYDYGKTIGWQFLQGRDFSRAYSSDSSGFVINESAAKITNLKTGDILHWRSKWLNIDQDFRILGVIKDMVMQSPYEQAKPTIFRLGGNPNWIYARINPAMSASEALARIAPIFRQYTPSSTFEYHFADEEYAKKFATEERIGKLATCFASLAIFISCLGLFGMASFMGEQRIKEIGVRKVLGASVFNLWRLLSKDFVTLIIISITIAIPVAYYFMHQWLLHYQLHIGISWWVFATTATGAIMITLATVSYHSIKAALANPVKSLRSE